MTDLEKRFLKNTDDTGRFIYQSLVTGRKYYVEPIGGHSDWGDINPATKKVEGWMLIGMIVGLVALFTCPVLMAECFCLALFFITIDRYCEIKDEKNGNR